MRINKKNAKWNGSRTFIRYSHEKSEITIANTFVHGAVLGRKWVYRIYVCESEWDGCDRWRWKSFHQKRIRYIYMKFVFAKPFPVIYLSFACFLIFLLSSASWAIRFAVRSCSNEHERRREQMHVHSYSQHKTRSCMHDARVMPDSLENFRYNSYRQIARKSVSSE